MRKLEDARREYEFSGVGRKAPYAGCNYYLKPLKLLKLVLIYECDGIETIVIRFIALTTIAIFTVHTAISNDIVSLSPNFYFHAIDIFHRNGFKKNSLKFRKCTPNIFTRIHTNEKEIRRVLNHSDVCL